MLASTIELSKDDETIRVTTDENGTFVQTTDAGNRQFGSDQHDEIVND